MARKLGGDALDADIKMVLEYQSLTTAVMQDTVMRAVGARDVLIMALLKKLGGSVVLEETDITSISNELEVMEDFNQDTNKWTLTLERVEEKEDEFSIKGSNKEEERSDSSV